MMNRYRKFGAADEPIATIAELDSLIQRDEWICLNLVPKHPYFIDGMSLGILRKYIRNGMLHHAVPMSDPKH